MEQSKAIAELSDRFKGGSEYDIQDVTGFFSGLKREDVGTVYQCIIRNHEYNTFPKLVKIRKYIAQDGIKISEKEAQKERVYEYYICQICKAIFDTEIGWCPVCKKNTPVKAMITKQKKAGAYEGRQGCAKCDKYNNRNICVSCDDFGKPLSSEMCHDCQGFNCCKEYKELRERGIE